MSRTANFFFYATKVKPYGVEAFMKITNSKNFGETVKNKRRQLGYTQKYVSEFTGLSISFLSDLENGKKTIELDKALNVANILGLDVELNERG